jgi:tRNA modification GTPase
MSGDSALSITRNVFKPESGSLPERGVVVGSLIDPARQQQIDRVVVIIFPGPGSYTGEDVVEFHCHGGTMTPRLVLRTLVESGCRPARRGEFTLRAFLNGRLDLLQAESVLDVIEARSELAQKEAVNRLEGSLSNVFSAVRQGILELSARVEYFLDFPEEDDRIEGLENESDRVTALVAKLEHLIETAMDREVLNEGVLTVIAGAPNVGKSSVFNLLLEVERAIVTPFPGTTRDAVEAAFSLEGLPLLLVDTAGLRDTEDPIEKKGIEFSDRYIDGADIIICVVEANRNLKKEERKFLEAHRNGCVVVMNKIDLGTCLKAKDLERYGPVVAMSCLERTGLAALKEQLVLAASRVLGTDEPAESPLVVRARHREGIRRAKEALERFGGALTELPPEILAIELREARQALEELTGEVTTEDMLGWIFEQFCVGK